MALAVPLRCDCGKLYQVYVPCTTVCESMPSYSLQEIEEARRIDVEDRENGAIDNIKALFDQEKDITFVDGGMVKIFHCDCGAIYDFGQIFTYKNNIKALIQYRGCPKRMSK